MSGRLDYNLQRTTAPTEEPITLEAAKRQCSIDREETFFDVWLAGDDEDSIGAIAAARELVEYDARVAIMPQTWTLRYDAWPDGDWIDLLIHPAQSVVVTYDDLNDATQTWAAANYQLQRGRYRSLLMKTDKDADYPDLSSSDPRPVQIVITAGYSNTTDHITPAARRNQVPHAARMAMLMLIGHWFRNRESVLIGTISKEIEQGYRSLIETIRPVRYA